MTVRTWFRLLRRSAWEGSVPVVTLYCRGNWQSPLGSAIRLYDLKDYQKLIDDPGSARPPLEVIRADVARYWKQLLDSSPYSD